MTIADTEQLDQSTPAAFVGRTPLVRLRAFETNPDVSIWAKLESRNPGGSVKDRAALAMILDGERRGVLGPGRILLDATSGNTGVAYAMLCAERGYPVRLCVPANVTPERKQLILAYGADIVATDPMEGSDGAIREARRLYAENSRAYFYPDQYNNDANWRAHYETTATEIIDETGGRLTHFVAGLGTSGTFVGVSRRLREWRSAVRRISVQPDSPFHAIEGLKHMASAIVPGIYDPGLADEAVQVSTEDAVALTQRLARECGLLVGPSSGAALAGCLTVAATLRSGFIVTVFPDGGDRYLSESFWQTRSLWLPAVHAERIRQHGIETYPDECCGALLGSTTGVVTGVLPIGNTAPDQRRRRFLVSPDDYRQAEKHADETGAHLIGFYHSHPDHPAVPSQFDLDHAWPGMSYAIVSIRAGQSQELRSWRLRPDRSGFDEETVTGTSIRSS